MNFIVFFWEDQHLSESQQCGKDGMICEEQVVEIDLTGLIIRDKIAITAVN